MKLTLRQILAENNMPIENTVYKTMTSTMLDYAFAAEKISFSAHHAPKDGGFGLLWEKRQAQQRFLQSKDYLACYNDIEALNEQLKNENLEIEQMRELRAKRKAVDIKAKELIQQENLRIDNALFNVDNADENAILAYKNFVFATNFEELKQRIPALENLNDALLQGGIYTKNIEQFAAISQGAKKIGIEGGPCLFGAWEVEIYLLLSDGNAAQFDFTTGEAFNKETFVNYPYEDVQDFILDYAGKIKQVKFFLHKDSLTTQEVAAMEYVIRASQAFNAYAYIPLPDMSYAKYLNSILSPIENEKVRNDAIYCFKELAHSQSDLFLNQADKLRIKYPSVPLYVIHERETAMMNVYMEKRKAFLEQPTTKTHRLTKRSAWAESIKDYITMPSMPYYLHGITEIIVADTLDEVDSTRKCIKLHDGVLNIQSLFFPEPISCNNLQSMFYAPRECKEYLNGLLAQPKEYGL